MHHVGIRQLRADAAAMVRRARSGERIVVTVNGQPAAVLAPAAAEGAAGAPSIDELASRSRVDPPRRRDPYRLPEPIPVWPGTRLDRLLAEVRG